MEIRLLKKDYIKKEGFYKDFLEDQNHGEGRIFLR